MTRALFLATLAAAAPAAAQTAFFTTVEDLPMAPGLAQETPGLVFEDFNGRIVGAAARGDAEPEAVRQFYLDTLPALGWAFSPGAGAAGDLVFLRGRERLALSISPYEGGAELHARLFVSAAPSLPD